MHCTELVHKMDLLLWFIWSEVRKCLCGQFQHIYTTCTLWYLASCWHPVPHWKSAPTPFPIVFFILIFKKFFVILSLKMLPHADTLYCSTLSRHPPVLALFNQNFYSVSWESTRNYDCLLLHLTWYSDIK